MTVIDPELPAIRSERRAAQAVMASLTPETQAAHHAAWKRCEEYVISLQRKGAKVFEVHHAVEHARRKYMALLGAYKAPDHCEREVRAMYCGAALNHTYGRQNNEHTLPS